MDPKLSLAQAQGRPSELLLRRIRRIGGLAILAMLVQLNAASLPPAEAGLQAPGPLLLMLATILLSASAAYRHIVAFVRTEDRRAAELLDTGRQDGVALAANTFRHHIGNKLAVTVAYSEMLADDPSLPPNVREHAQKVLSSAAAVVEVFRKVDGQLARLAIDTSVAGPPLLDVNASAGSHD
ncbi:MAG: hypothetical protein LC797_01725 [Chloroflexi bacterium]|nr:hypothetical protein [Chloroflexota bacterium]